MQRRTFLQSLALAGLRIAPAGGALFSAAAQAAADYPAAVLEPVAAANLPRYINVFLYGGPSELAGNLSNILDINANSQNSYGGAIDLNNGDNITAHGFWREAGGDHLEAMLAAGDMTLYRTMYRRKDDSKGHGRSVTQNLAGNLDTNNPGIGATLAWILSRNNPFNKPVEDLLFPIVTLEGESRAFTRGDLAFPLTLKPIALSYDLDNPYQRSRVSTASLDNGGVRDQSLEDLAQRTNASTDYDRLTEGFVQRRQYAADIDTLFANADVAGAVSTYGYGDGNFGRRLSAAVNLALANPETVFISVGSGGLGGWDDHSDALIRYPARMNELMTAIHAAVTQLNAAAANGVAHADKIVINVFGDFGRNVNLNESRGWDHGNNQNLYTFGGRGIPGRGLGKVVGQTVRIGDRGVNRQFTAPADGSYEFEPFALASTMFRNFGVVNPEVLTGEAPIDETAT